MEIIYQKTDINVEKDKILFSNPQFTSEMKLFLRKRGTKNYHEIPAIISKGTFNVSVDRLQEILNENTEELLRYDLYVKQRENDDFEALISEEVPESNQYESLNSTSVAHKFIKIYPDYWRYILQSLRRNTVPFKILSSIKTFAIG